jgi:hypothetical protein
MTDRTIEALNALTDAAFASRDRPLDWYALVNIFRTVAKAMQETDPIFDGPAECRNRCDRCDPLPAPASGDWPEDFPHENGNYCCVCSVCENVFRGHKRRTICRACANNPTPAPASIMGEKMVSLCLLLRHGPYGGAQPRFCEAADALESLSARCRELEGERDLYRNSYWAALKGGAL